MRRGPKAGVLLAVLLLAVGQFAAIFWFLSRGGTDVYFPDDIKTRFSDVWGQDAVLERVKETYPYISLDTVYRNLSLLTNTGLVNQINLQAKGISLFEFQGEAHHHHAVVGDKRDGAVSADVEAVVEAREEIDLDGR